ncbi:MAG TPA: hypothetical protein VIO38_06420 [Rariglobus sp.]
MSRDAETIEVLREKLHRLREESLQLEAEIAARDTDRQLRLDSAPDVAAKDASPVLTPTTPAAKITLFLDLFGTRRSVFPKLWENVKTGRKGYSPACDNEWRSGICQKPRVKCSECPHQKFPPLDARAVESHLRGQHTLGVYAIGEDNTCRFLAADFDGEGWRGDRRGGGAFAFRQRRACLDVFRRTRFCRPGPTPRPAADRPRLRRPSRARPGGL